MWDYTNKLAGFQRIFIKEFFCGCIIPYIYGKGAIDSFVINMYFKEVKTKLTQRDPDAEANFMIEDIKDEIFDMAKPEVPNAITLNDLINCGQGDVIVSILTDAKAFFDYDHREFSGTQGNEEENFAMIAHQAEVAAPIAQAALTQNNTNTATFGKTKKVHTYNEV